MTELLIVVAIIALLAGIAFLFVDPQTIYHVEYDRNAESIATALQNRFAEMRTAGQLDSLLTIGEKATPKNSIISGASLSTDSGDEGGYRYLFSYDEDGKKNTDMSDLLPFGSLESDVAAGYYAVGFYANTGSVGQVFWSQEKFKAHTTAYLNNLANDLARRKTDKVGYYEGSVDTGDVAFAQLPTPQLTITNYEQLTLSIYLPEVQELKALNKVLGLRISMADEDLNAYKGGLTYDDTAIYKTYGTGTNVMSQTVQMGETYKLILDTPNNVFYTPKTEPAAKLSDTPSGTFEQWAQRTAAYRGHKNNPGTGFKLGDDVTVTVTVFCVNGDEGTNQEVDPTYMPRSGSVTFNGWFDSLHSSGSNAYIACGRHLQNLAKLTALNSDLATYLPDAEKDYANASRGAGYYFNDRGSSSNITNKYQYVKTNDTVVQEAITKANQVMAIDFQCKDWMQNGTAVGYDNQILFEPINLPSGFRYNGNYLTIKHLKVDAPFYAGLFGYVYHATIYDVLLVNPSVHSQMPLHVAEFYEMGVGSLIGTSRSSSDISNCQSYVEAEGGSFKHDLYRVTGEGYVGGLIGFCEDEHMRENSASVYVGEEDGSSRYVGGLIGCITGDASVLYSYVAGNLRGQYVGGLIGLLLEDTDNTGDDYTVNGCYTAGHIERATQSASGLIGYIDEQGGYTKSALCVYQNYCAIIYGKGNGLPTDWEDSKITKYTYQADGTVTSVETDAPTPIYGTFEGDGYKWLTSNSGSAISSGSQIEGGESFGGALFFGADFQYDNENYFFPQKGIPYRDSKYFEDSKQIAQDFLNALPGSTSPTDLISTTRDKLMWARQRDSLEELKTNYERLIEQFSKETAVSPASKRKYNEGGYSNDGENSSDSFYIDKWRINYSIESGTWQDAGKTQEYDTSQTAVADKAAQTRYANVTMLQLMKCLYDGTWEYTDKDGNPQEVKIKLRDKEQWANKDADIVAGKEPVINEGAYEGKDCTFMYFYDLAKGALGRLIDGTSTDAAADKALLDKIFGTGDKYTTGLLYTHNLARLYEGLNRSKDYYQSYQKDAVGEQTFYYYRDRWMGNRLLEVLHSMTLTDARRQQLLQSKKEATLSTAIAYIDEFTKASENWTESPLDEIKKTGGEKAAKAMGELVKLKTLVEGLAENPPTTNLEELRTQAEAAYAAYDALYDFFDKETVTKITETDDGKVVSETVNVKDVKADNAVKFLDNKEKDDFGYYQKGTGYQLAHEDMRGFRDLFDDVRYDISAVVNVINSGVDGALDLLEYKLTCTSSKYTDASAIEECKNNLNLLLGTDWEGHDSGHRIYSATELREIRHQDYIGDEFFYRYSKYPEVYGDLIEGKDDAYIDQDNGIYNNVFPYNEKGDLTRYYPYLMVKGRAIADGGSNDKGLVATVILFHYGDWLTSEMIAEDPVNHKYHIQKSNAEQQKELLQSVSAQIDTVKETVKGYATANGGTGSKSLYNDKDLEEKVNALFKNLGDTLTSVQNLLKNSGSLPTETVQPVYESLNEIYTSLVTINGWGGKNNEKDLPELKVATKGYAEQFDALITDMKTLWPDLKEKETGGKN